MYRCTYSNLDTYNVHVSTIITTFFHFLFIIGCIAYNLLNLVTK